MHVAVDFNGFLQFLVLAFAAAFGLLYLVRNTASRYFVVDSNFDPSAADYSALDCRKVEGMKRAVGGASVAAEGMNSCAVCGLLTKKQCARCKMVKYCSEACQKSHWNSEHKTKCKDLQSFYKAIHAKAAPTRRGRKALASVGGNSKTLKQSNKILFPYEEFVEYFKWDKPGYPPCGLINCGNSCFANVVLQCLSYTRPLVAYLLEKGHRIDCQREDWCFLCEFQMHVESANRSSGPFSPMNILSRLPNIGSNLGYGKQEDAHEFMRFAIDTMQSVCLDEFGGEKAVHPSYQVTTLIQHIFGGRLQSQVICAECNNVSNQFENMMDLTVEIHGDAGSLEECLDQFTAKESLHGDNMYKCDGCNAYVMAWKRLTIQQAPNILTIALKRFQSGRFGKLNKRVTFPETLVLSPYMSDREDGNDIYKLYAVIVHVDMLNASYFGHYICYVKDFRGNWYKVDDCKVIAVNLDEMLSQGAYMLMYSRICARPSSLLPTELLKKEESKNVKINEVDGPLEQTAGYVSRSVCIDSPADSEPSLTSNCTGFKINCEEELLITTDAEVRGDTKMVFSDKILPITKNLELHSSNGLPNGIVKTNPTANSYSHLYPCENSLLAQDSESLPSIPGVEVAHHDSKVDLPVSSLRKLTYTSTASEKCSLRDGSITSISAMHMIPSEVTDAVNSSDSTSMGYTLEHGNGLISQNAVKKSYRGNSTGQHTPAFAWGSYGNNPKTKCMEAETNVISAGMAEFTRECHLSNHNDKVAKPCSLGENGGLLRE